MRYLLSVLMITCILMAGGVASAAPEADYDVLQTRISEGNFVGERVADVITTLAKSTGVQVVVNAKLDGQVKMIFEGKTFRQIMDILADAFNFNWKFKEGMVVVSTADTMTQRKTYVLRWVNLDNAKKQIGTFVSEAKIIINPETASLTIDASTANHEKIRELLDEVDIPVRQVLIQAQMVEVNRTDALKAGFEYAWSHKSALDSPWKFKYTLTFNANEIFNKGNILARPSIVAHNGQETKLAMTDKVPVITYNVAADGSNKTATIDYKDVGVKLTVTPRINNGDTDYVTLKIHPEVSAISKWVESNGNKAPQIAFRETDSTIRVRSGETIIIGGLLKAEEIDNLTQVPVISQLPLIGNIFKFKNYEKTQTEVFIFVTPVVLPEGSANDVPEKYIGKPPTVLQKAAKAGQEGPKEGTVSEPGSE